LATTKVIVLITYISFTMFLWFPVLDLARAPRRTARKKGSGYENGSSRVIGTAKPCSESPRFFARAPAILAVIFVGTSCNIFVLSIYSPYLNNRLKQRLKLFTVNASSYDLYK
jgi:hypothetical protein